MHQQLVDWQKSVEHWKGSDITAGNSRLVRHGELTKLSSNSNWTREVIVFLFDKDIVLCKKVYISASLNTAITWCHFIEKKNGLF